MPQITPEEVKRLAALANIGLTVQEIDLLTKELDEIVGFVEQLKTVDIKDAAPTDQVTGLVDVWREDVVQPGLNYDDLKANAPDWQDGYYKVKRVFPGE